MSCRKIRRSLSQYYKGELSAEKEKLVAQHVLACQGCAREAQRYKIINDAVQNLEVFEPSPEFEARLKQRINEIPYLEKKDRKKAVVTSFPSLRWAFIPVTALVITLVLLIKGGFYKSQTTVTKPELVSTDSSLLARTPAIREDTSSSEKTPIMNEGEQLVSAGFQAIEEENKTLIVKKSNPRAFFVIDNLRSSDLERIPDNKYLKDRLNNYVMDAVKLRPVDYKSLNEGYILPAVSTSETEAKISY
jgi:hypothetical protein